MDHKHVFAGLQTICLDVISTLNGSSSNSSNADAAERLLGVMKQIQEHGRAVEPLITGFMTVYHHFDLDEQTPGNGYRTLVKVVHSCIIHITHKARYIASNCTGAFFRMDHNVAEMEAYCSALCQLRALLYLAQVLLNDNPNGQLYSQEEGGLSERFVQEYISMHKACFYGRCLGFQFSPSLRPFLQTVVISMVSFGENYKKQQTGLGIAALSFFTSGKYVVDPELRGAEFERITQNLDMQFWKTFWNITETELLSGLTRITSSVVQVNVTLTVPAESLSLPLASDPSLSVAVKPPVAHWGPGPVNVRLISHVLRQGQDSAELLSLSRPEGPQLSLSGGFNRQTAPLSPCLLIHFHGGGFVAQTSKSHENYLKSWSKDLNVPILSVDYSLAPEAPFPRALEECFYAYCWALKNCHLLGSTAEHVCLVGDSAGGNLCITVSMRAMSHGVRVPDGIVAAYPATLLTTDASPSRLLTLIDPLLPLSVLYKCIDAYAGLSCRSVQPAQQLDTLAALGQDTVKMLSKFAQGATNWIQTLLDPKAPPSSSSTASATTSSNGPSSFKPHSEEAPQEVKEYPENFEPLRSSCLVDIKTPCTPIMKNPFVSPLLAPDSLLKGLPPVHIVASALDALLDDSVMFAKKLRNMNQPVTLTVVEDLPHGFLSLLQLSKETQEAADICVKRIREVLKLEEPTDDQKQSSVV
ncbi:lipase, hormone-sensitive a isoform X1 [Danio rerio]|uniref:Hormone-sensitive lipase n=1 Tax=Danio rerio TaxID=7955 RepID=A3KPJ7_DANRE|nr:lipase, hormone-sensitive a [Danio rerio]XP_005159552.1 hormone-sensitive lipase isoform X1 [Danio rerio]|eukprot:NP_001303654.1 hormone-sensitive lipase [Danio rerio]